MVSLSGVILAKTYDLEVLTKPKTYVLHCFGMEKGALIIIFD